MAKYVTIRFYTTPRRYGKDMDKAKDALMKAKEAGMSDGEVNIDNVTVKIENAIRSSPCGG